MSDPLIDSPALARLAEVAHSSAGQVSLAVLANPPAADFEKRLLKVAQQVRDATGGAIAVSREGSSGQQDGPSLTIRSADYSCLQSA